ncbi:hypothetical protein O181_018498 [Austropuccinia psidii MF-1]|uniref:Uncharacterized protein n=1 Tax=Austropuccinia psidii MF-1 TaxID=1389203 RepID=A0A9Q3C973_9BASI|nr:hypothetical protein [Austropuccinia psidii MF-1]
MEGAEPSRRGGEAGDEEEEESAEEEESEENEVEASLEGTLEASEDPNLALSNQPDPDLLKMMEQMTQFMGQLTQEVAPRDD